MAQKNSKIVGFVNFFKKNVHLFPGTTICLKRNHIRFSNPLREQPVYHHPKVALPVLLILVVWLAMLPMPVLAGLLHTESINETVPLFSLSPIDSVDFKIFLQDSAGLMTPVPVFEQTFTELDAGTSLIFDSGPLFTQATDLLTNDVDDFVTVYVGSANTTYNESSFFDLTPDFFGNQLTSIEAHLDSIDIVSHGQLLNTHIASLDFSGTLEIRGQSLLPEPGGILLGLCGLIGLFTLSSRQRNRS